VSSLRISGGCGVVEAFGVAQSRPPKASTIERPIASPHAMNFQMSASVHLVKTLGGGWSLPEERAGH
jgi:hypothetical protein